MQRSRKIGPMIKIKSVNRDLKMRNDGINIKRCFQNCYNFNILKDLKNTNIRKWKIRNKNLIGYL